MNMTLINRTFESFGIFGELLIQDGERVAVTLQHAYSTGIEGCFMPKMPEGSYKCRRGTHRLASMNHTFETFEVKKVPGHTGILFHIGNENADSEGCVLLGESVMNGALRNSRLAFERFMAIHKDINEFTLTVVNAENLTPINRLK